MVEQFENGLGQGRVVEIEGGDLVVETMDGELLGIRTGWRPGREKLAVYLTLPQLRALANHLRQTPPTYPIQGADLRALGNATETIRGTLHRHAAQAFQEETPS